MPFQDRLIINVALTGMVPTKVDNPYVPISPVEIAEDVRRCHEAGASIFHIHARDAAGQPAYQAAYYEEILAQVRARCHDPQIVICLTTSGRVHNTFETRSQVLDLPDEYRPDMASLTLGSMNFPKQASVNAPDMILALARAMQSRGIVPELEVFDLGMIDYSHVLLERGVLQPPLYYNILLGSLGTLSATPLNLALMVNALPAGATWAAAGIGRFQFQMNALAIAMGGHVRVGIEDALYMTGSKTDLASNPRLVERLVGVACSMGREPATSIETRKMIGLQPRIELGHRTNGHIEHHA